MFSRALTQFAAVASPPRLPGNVAQPKVDNVTPVENDITPSEWLRVGRFSVRAPKRDVAVRLSLVGMSILLLNLIEVPHEFYWTFLGVKGTAIFNVLSVAGALASLFAAVTYRTLAWEWLRSLTFQRVVLVALIGAALFNLQFLGQLAAAPFRAPDYPNDGTTLDHYAAQQLLAGNNPYVSTDLVAAIRQFHQDPTRTTPLRSGDFASLSPTQYPNKYLLRFRFNLEPVGNPDLVKEFESRVSYPALAFLPLVPLVWAGAPNVTAFFLLCLIALAAMVIASFPRELRWWAVLAVMASNPFLVAALNGSLDIFYITLVFAAWLLMRRSWTSAILFGLALAAKQLAWFMAPFYFIAVWKREGWREAVKRAGVASGVFAAINGPFFIDNPSAWMKGVLAPMADPMFPLGNGLVKLGLTGVGPLAPQVVYSGLELLAIVVCLAYYIRRAHLEPELGLVLAVIPLFFAWRSLTTYFDYVALPTIALYAAARLRAGAPAFALRDKLEYIKGFFARRRAVALRVR